MQNELKPCPFCNGKAEIHEQPLLTNKGVCVRCTNRKCGTRSMFVLYDCEYLLYKGNEKVYVSKEQAINDVTEKWNRRVDNAE